MVALGVFKGVNFAIFTLRGSSKLHDRMLNRVLRASLAFFDSTPPGNVLNRFSKDLDEVDVRVSYYMELVGQILLFCLTQVNLIKCC